MLDLTHRWVTRDPAKGCQVRALGPRVGDSARRKFDGYIEAVDEAGGYLINWGVTRSWLKKSEFRPVVKVDQGDLIRFKKDNATIEGVVINDYQIRPSSIRVNGEKIPTWLIPAKINACSDDVKDIEVLAKRLSRNSKYHFPDKYPTGYRWL